ncbi:LapA family protein [Nevskia sp.]|uniref:LapA family protein n=1 Tax=Nevskia sp. TaxID=1929292 RepID=UPI0025E09907|nr:LapA family protein [Nevskia sp.]
MLRLLTVVLLVLVFAIGAGLGYFNAERVTFDYLFGTTEVRVAVLVAVSFIAAALLTLLLCGLRILRLHRDIRRLRKQLRDSETELKNLRNLPLAGGR